MFREYKMKLSEEQFYEHYLRIKNLTLPEPLSNKEIIVLSEFLKMPRQKLYDRFRGRAKQIVLDRLRKRKGWENFSSASLTNYITSLKRKNIITEDSEKVKKLNNDILNDLEKGVKEIRFKFEITK